MDASLDNVPDANINRVGLFSDAVPECGPVCVGGDVAEAQGGRGDGHPKGRSLPVTISRG